MAQFSLRSLLLVFSFLLGACGSSQTAPEFGAAGRSTASTSLPTVTGQADGAPAGCSVQEVAQELQDFAVAFNDGDQQHLLTLFSNRAPFAWYSAPESDSTFRDIYTVDELPQYFEQRHTQHEHLEFKWIQVNGWEEQRGLVHFAFAVNRRADDLNSGQAREVIGKGALHCKTKTFVVISIGSG
jgi:hypothetical protein